MVNMTRSRPLDFDSFLRRLLSQVAQALLFFVLKPSVPQIP